MLKKVIVVLGLAAVVLGFLISRKPDEFSVTRSAVMAAPAAKVFAQVNDLHKWEAWSPWATMDPNAKMAYEGPREGVGAAMSWAGNMKVGTGRMTITESHPNDLIRFRLDFLKPFKATNTAEFTFKPEGKQTLVAWSMYGKSNFVSKVMSLLMDCDKMVGGQFEQGLANLKSVVE